MKVPLTTLDLLTRARRYFPDRIGVIDGDQQWTYAEFADRCDRQARYLTDELGVQRGDVVAWLCGNTHELLEAYYGVLLAGAVLLPLVKKISAGSSSSRTSGSTTPPGWRARAAS